MTEAASALFLYGAWSQREKYILSVGGFCNKFSYIFRSVSLKYNVFEIIDPCENKDVGKIKIDMWWFYI
jgi:hypothetical protein